LQLARLKRTVGGTLDARAKAAGLDRVGILPGDMYVLFDGGKEGNRSKTNGPGLDAPLKPRVARTLQLVFSEDSVAERRGYSRREGGQPPAGRAVLARHALQAQHADEEA
jgi:hypothetical protein